MARRFKSRSYKLRGRWKRQPGVNVQVAGAYIDLKHTEAGGQVSVDELMSFVDDPANPLYTVVEHDAEVGLRKYQREQLSQFMAALIRVNMYTDGTTEEMEVFQAVIVDEQRVPILDADDADGQGKRLGSVTNRDFFIDHKLVRDNMAQVAVYNETVRTIDQLHARLVRISKYADPALAPALANTKRSLLAQIKRLKQP